MQVWLHALSGAMQLETQVPLSQNWLAPHWMPQPPQLFASDVVFTQLLPHLVRPGPQLQLPNVQVPPGPQSLLQAPQCCALKLVNTQEPPQFVWLPKHCVWQELKLQTWFAAQALPQEPQLSGSEEVRVHTPPQLVKPGPQVHVPLLQVGFVPPQVELQAPQCCRSLLVFTHRPLQFVNPTGQVVVPEQAPLTHDWVALQATPHAPQFVLSVPVFTHRPLQLVSPGPHEHMPLLQVAPAAHALPQAPQFAASVCVFVQTPLHAVWPLGHTHAPP